MEKLTIGISSCLAGNRVRYDGRDKKNNYVTDDLSRWFSLRNICPEVECGLLTPREPMNVERIGGLNRLISVHTREDITPQIDKWLHSVDSVLDGGQFDGFILQSKSPCCGYGDTKLFNRGSSKVLKMDSGLFASHLLKKYPYIPVINVKDLRSQEERLRFISALFILKVWREVVALRLSLNEFHTLHRYKLLSYGSLAFKKLNLIMGLKRESRGKIDLYGRSLLKLLEKKIKHGNVHMVLMKIFNEMKPSLNREERFELLHAIDMHRQGNVPLLEPITLIRHYALVYDYQELLNQTFLEPEYGELNLSYHA